MTIPLAKLNCRHCKLWHTSDCEGIQYKNLNETGESYCLHIFKNFSEDEILPSDKHSKVKDVEGCVQIIYAVIRT